MTEHKFTDDEIIEGLDAYVSRMCNKCKVKDLGTCCGSCFITVISQSTDLINRQRAEIERLKDNEKYIVMNGVDEVKIIFNRKEIKAEAIKEFAERLKEKAYDRKPYGGRVIDEYEVYVLVKEMTEIDTDVP